MRFPLVAAFALMVVFVPSVASAAGCAAGQSPFTDVPDNSIFCSDALWLRNALVTFGCGNGTTYCPGEDVPRAQMALFMKRLARAVTPDIVVVDGPSTPAGDIDGGGFGTCLTSAYVVPAGQNPRIMLEVAGTVSILTDGPAEIVVEIQYSVNGGLFSTLLGGARVTVPGNQWTAAPVLWSQTISNGNGALVPAGSTTQWRIRMVRSSGSTTGELTNHRCFLKVTLPVDAASS